MRDDVWVQTNPRSIRCSTRRSSAGRRLAQRSDRYPAGEALKRRSPAVASLTGLMWMPRRSPSLKDETSSFLKRPGKKKKEREKTRSPLRHMHLKTSCFDVWMSRLSVSAPGQRACAGRSVGRSARPRCARPGSSGRLFGCRVLVRPLCPHNRMTRRATVLQGSRCRKSSTVCGKNWQKQRHRSEPRRLHHPR